MCRLAALKIAFVCLLVSLCGCGGHGLIPPGETQFSSWKVGPNWYTFNNVHATIDPATGQLYLLFSETHTISLGAHVAPGKASAIKVQEPVALNDKSDIAFFVGLGDNGFRNDPSSPGSLEFSTLETYVGGTVAGTIVGTLFDDTDRDGIPEYYPLAASFVGIFTDMPSN